MKNSAHSSIHSVERMGAASASSIDEIASTCYDDGVRTTISIPQPLLENARQRAAERGITLSVLVEDALRRQLAEVKTGAAPPFRLYTVRGRLVNPHLDLDRTSALLLSEDETQYAKRRS